MLMLMDRTIVKIVGICFATSAIIYTLVIPLVLSLLQFQRYQSIVSQDNYVNATIRSIENKQPFLQRLVTGCYIKTNYEFIYNGSIVNSQDNLNCKYDSQLVVGNTLPVFYDAQNPEDSATSFSQISKPSELFTNSLVGFCLLAIMIMIWLFMRHRKAKPHYIHPDY